MEQNIRGQLYEVIRKIIPIFRGKRFKHKYHSEILNTIPK